MSRRQRRELQRKYNKLGLVRKNDFVPAEMLDKYLGQEDKKNNYVGNFSLKWLMENKNFISTAIREYQRLKIKSTEWKQIIVWDILNGGPVGGEIIVRVINKDDYKILSKTEQKPILQVLTPEQSKSLAEAYNRKIYKEILDK